MKPIEFPEQNTVFAKDQPEYLPLPAHMVKEPEGRVITCWKLTREERLEIFCTGLIWLQQMTFGAQLQPQLPSAESPFQPAKPDPVEEARRAALQEAANACDTVADSQGDYALAVSAAVQCREAIEKMLGGKS